MEYNGEAEHVHLLLTYPPTVQLSRLVNSLKGVSSRRLRQEFPELARHYWQARRLWSRSYFAGSVGGAPLNVLRPTSSSSADPTTQFTSGLKAGALLRKTGSRAWASSGAPFTPCRVRRGCRPGSGWS